MKQLIFIILLVLLLCGNAFAYDATIQKIEIAPLNSGISFNTVSVTPGWVTAPTVEMVGRKRVLIQNNSTTTSISLTGVSGSTAVGTLGAGKVASFGAASNLHIYMSATVATSVDVWEIR